MLTKMTQCSTNGRIVKDPQNLNIAGHFDVLFENLKKDGFFPDIIVELGTGAGWFHQCFVDKGNFIIHTYDIKDIVDERARVERINYHVLDIFGHEHEISELFKLGRVLLLCDNGDKAREVKIFSKYLKTGDVMMVHDYCYDLELHNKHRYIGSCEVIYSEIADSLENFELYYHDFMMVVGWGSFRRK